MVSIVCYGVGTGYSSSTGCPTGVKSTFDYDEKIWASHCWEGLSGGEDFIIIWDRKISGNWNTELFHEWTNPGYSAAYQCAWIQNYPSGEWRVRFNVSGYGVYSSYFTLEEPSIPEYQYYDVSGTPTGAEIWEGSNFIGIAPMSLRLSYTDHYLTFKKTGYEDQTIHVGTKPGGETIYISYSLTPILPSIKETIQWEGTVPSGSHSFYLLSLYGINTNNTIGGFQIYNGTYKTAIIYSPGQSRQDDLTTHNVSKYDCLTIIAENYDGSNITGIYDAYIQNNVI